ncbi:hypothetical protein [Nannocystis punicea]|uniref:Crocagin biosynthetic protein CgnE/B domain-containing protein n=1 Tax=Nannocystis punicea TaxID=2995304 RepID=A0ABY7GX19_9BACT|nr:hypothetical protein [Nannocystis poenicansa]WAS91506.1 hypothetical protein O0S08_35435 [Nannocystis poenicansa]
MQATTFFKRLFDRTMPVLVDDARHLPFLARRGFTARPIGDFDFASTTAQPVFVIFTEAAAHEAFLQRWGEIPGITAHLSLAKFDTSPEIIEYSIDQLLDIDFAATLARRSAHYDAILSCDYAEVTPPHGPLRCSMGESVEIANRDDEMEPGWLYSVSEFLEASLVNIERDRSTFCLDGEFAFDGLIYLFNNPELRSRVGWMLEEWVRLAARGGNSATLVGNSVTRLTLGGLDRTEQLLELTGGKERQSAATEFAFGCVDYSLAAQDWSRNSVMHESFWGIHVGIGMGQDIPHFDLIARRAECRHLHLEPASPAEHAPPPA